MRTTEMQIPGSRCSLVMTNKTGQTGVFDLHELGLNCYGALHSTGEDGANNLALGREHGKIGVSANRDLSLAIAYADDARGIQCREAHGILQLPVGELGHVANGSVERQHASGENSVEFGAIALHLHLKTAEHVSAISHTGRADAVSNEYSGLNSLRTQEQAHHVGMN